MKLTVEQVKKCLAFDCDDVIHEEGTTENLNKLLAEVEAPAQPKPDLMLTEKEIIHVLYNGRTMVNFSHVPQVTRAIDWLRQDFHKAFVNKEAAPVPPATPDFGSADELIAGLDWINAHNAEVRAAQPSEPTCPDCRVAAGHSYSDATTPGFFSSKCDKHRSPAASEPSGESREIARMAIDDWLRATGQVDSRLAIVKALEELNK